MNAITFRSSVRLLVILSVGLAARFAFAQGSLTPPGPPAPIFKTLEQVEPRRPISVLPFNITQSGSYYLTTNLFGTAGQSGITLNADNVTLDLSGYALSGVVGSLDGVFLNGRAGSHVRNGVISGWGRDGVGGTNSDLCLVEELRVRNNVRHGIIVGAISKVQKCLLANNGSVGLSLGSNAEADGCTVTGSSSHGIQAGTGSTIRHCISSGNLSTGITGSGIDGLTILECSAAHNSIGISTLGQTIVKDCFARTNTLGGILVGPGSLVQGCNASDNGTNGITTDLGCTVQGCIAENNKGDGITARNATSVLNCSARLNLFDNIEIDGDCVVSGNTCDNSAALTGTGIHALTSDNRIENNNLTDNRTGLRVDGANNYVANNTVRNNTTNYVIVTGNQLNILLSQLPLFVPWPATIKVAGTLTGVNNTNGITIASDDVTIDLNDHSLVGAASSHNGILVFGARTNITVRNGSVSGWPLDGVDASTAANSQLRNVSATRNGGGGILVGEGGLITGCSARSNTLAGISTGSGSRVADCSSSRNTTGIVLGLGGTASGLNAFDNAGVGISGGAGSVIQNCTAYSNGTNGITTQTGGEISGCTSRANSGNGIAATLGAVLLNNNCSANVFTGIQVTGTGGRIDGNHCTGGQRSFLINGTDNLIIRNSAQGASVLAYDILAGNHDAARVTSPGAAFASTSPWANFSF